MRMTSAEFEALMKKREQSGTCALPGKPAPKFIPARACHKAGEMNKTEAAFSEYLEAQRRAGQIREWTFEPERLILADKTSYTPDFRVIQPDGTVVFYEVKGHWEDDARVKIKVAARLHPYIFIAVKREKGQWAFEKFTKTEGGHDS